MANDAGLCYIRLTPLVQATMAHVRGSVALGPRGLPTRSDWDAEAQGGSDDFGPVPLH